jgi:branched-chain amino acid transport system permease protein/neutral amino acid transport system permease protein
MQFAITNIFNIAMGSQLTLAAFIGYEVNHAGATIWLAMAIAGLFTGVTSVLLNRGLFQPFLRRGTTFFGILVVGIALLLILQYTAQAIWGPSFFSYTFSQGAQLQWGSLTFTRAQLVILGISVVAMGGVHALLAHTRFGKAMRATASDSDLASSCGIRTELVTDVTWFVSGTLCGIGGVALGMTLGAFSTSLGSTFLLEIIAAAILGGIGQAYGAMVGALIIGIVAEESALALSSAYSQVSAFVILVVVLLVRPQGIFPGVARSRGLAG